VSVSECERGESGLSERESRMSANAHFYRPITVRIVRPSESVKRAISWPTNFLLLFYKHYM
jgi:hypothetical protein